MCKIYTLNDQKMVNESCEYLFFKNHQNGKTTVANRMEWNLAFVNCWHKQWLVKMNLSLKLIKQEVKNNLYLPYFFYFILFLSFYTSINSKWVCCSMSASGPLYLHQVAPVESLLCSYILMSDCTAMNKTRTLRICMWVIYNILCCQNIESANFQFYAWAT